MYHRGYILYEYASGYNQVFHKVAFSAAETIKFELTYERDVSRDGVFIQAYHTDKGVFTSKYFMSQVIYNN